MSGSSLARKTHISRSSICPKSTERSILKKKYPIFLLAAAAVLLAAVFFAGRRNTKERTLARQTESPELLLAAAGQGDLVTFGRFEQNGDSSDGPEPLEWFVLYREENEEGGSDLLLLSRYCISCRAYHSPVGDITWKDSTVRAYLNGEFLQETFTDKEQTLLRKTVNENPGNDLLGIDGGPDTEDNAFLLNQMEYGVYFQQEDARWLIARAEPTPQAVREGIYVAGEDPKEREDLREDEAGFTRWWLRGPGNEAYSAQIVEENGEIFEGGAAVDIDYMYGLRPALWIRLPE